MFDLAQTFFVDKKAAANSDTIYITSVSLFFKSKPVANKTASGLPEPGVSVYIAPCDNNGVPVIEAARDFHKAYVTYSNITTSDTGSTAVNFKLANPFPAETNKSYAFLVKYDGSDSGFVLWYNQSGATVVNTTTTSQTKTGSVDGNLFQITNGSTLTPLHNTDLSFKIFVAKFDSTSQTYKFKSRRYEFLKAYTLNGRFTGGEDVYQQRSALTGTVSINASSNALIGTGTSFNTQLAAGVKFVITDGTPGNTDVREVASVTNATYVSLTVKPSFTNASGSYYKTVTGRVHLADNDTDNLTLFDSTANSTIYLTTDTTVIGVDSLATANIQAIQTIPVIAAVPAHAFSVPKNAEIDVQVRIANSTLGTSNTYLRPLKKGTRTTFEDYPALISSASQEVTAPTPFNSVESFATFTTKNAYAAPQINQNNIDLIVETVSINNDATDEYKGAGAAKARYVSKAVSLADGQLAEDMQIYTRLYRPPGTDIRVYAKFRHPSDSEPMSSKQWTEFVGAQSNTLYSSPVNRSDYIELSYAIPVYPSGGVLQTGTFTGSLSNNVLVGTSGAVNTGITTGDLVRVYVAAIPTNFFIDTVTTSNTTSLTLYTGISNTSFVTSGLRVEKVVRDQSAYIDSQQSNTLSYFDQTGAKYTGYKDYQIKVVMLSSDPQRYPSLDDIRAIALSA